ncbi:MAG: FAD/NAD(P)-binding protein [Alphaproteobacteria bacterium]|nr:FAD/NAD(P)-binding protein [Alphaproteobacteria bacterium]
MTGTSIAVIGAGFSGTLMALHLLRRCPASTSVLLFERNSQFGRGQAYSTGNPNHLLNVPAAKMSAFGDRPLDFLSWLRTEAELGAEPPPSGSGFVSRHRFGSYVRHLLNEELRGGRDRLQLIRGDVQSLRRSGNDIVVECTGKRPVRVNTAVLAVGNFPPEPPPVADPSFYGSALYRSDPWAPDAFAGLDPAAPVLLIGTGLTMVDAVISLLDAGHAGPITALSRRGLLPLRHAPGAVAEEPAPAFPTSVVALLQVLRRESAHSLLRGGTWQQVVDQLRPFMQDVWQAMSLADRARFLRHLRPWWDIHRHRMAGPVAERIEAARHRGQLRILAGRIRAYAAHDGVVQVTYRPRQTDRLATLTAARVVNCSGPGCDFDRIADPLVRDLLESGLARPDPLRLGLDVSGTCALRGRDGAIAPNLFAIGPATKGAFWEITAVPDIRRQCEYLAGHLAGLVKPAASPPRLRAAALHLVAATRA